MIKSKFIFSSDYITEVAKIEARGVEFTEIRDYLAWLYDYIVDIDRFLLIEDNRYDSIFKIENSLTFDRQFILETLQRMDIFNMKLGNNLHIKSQPLTYFLSTKSNDENFLVELKEEYKNTLDSSILFFAGTHFIGQIQGKINSILEIVLSTIIDIETIYVKNLETSKSKKIIKDKLLQIEKSKIQSPIQSPKSVFLRDHYREKEEKIYELLKRNIEQEIDEVPPLINILLKSLKKVQGLRGHLLPGEKARTKMTAEFIEKFIAKDESGYGFSENLKTVGETDIIIETIEGDVVSICEGFNLKNSLDKNIINRHINKLFTYDVNGLKENFIIVFVDSNNFSDLWEKYYLYITTVPTQYKFTEIHKVSQETLELPVNIKLCKLTYLSNNKNVHIYHFFVDMKENKVK